MDPITPNPYDAFAYPGRAFPQTHPDRLSTTATLFGMSPASIQGCRVLELGCGDGLNLIPMAMSLPGSEFVGVDLAACPIAKGQEIKEQLGLRNLRLVEADLRAVDASFGNFDYIIAHGVYSWVPAEVRRTLLQVCHDRLAPQGVAFVSYNAHPGAHIREMTRGMMRLLDDCSQPSAQRIYRAKALMQFLSGGVLNNDAYEAFLKHETQRVLDHPDALLIHDDLAEINHAEYFCQFEANARHHGLQFLADADLFEMHVEHFSQPVIDQLSDLKQKGRFNECEQLLDFLKCRRFRQDLLCHAAVPRQREPVLDRIPAMHFASSARPDKEPVDLAEGADATFATSRGARACTPHPLAKVALLQLVETWPLSISFEQLHLASLDRLNANVKLPGTTDVGTRLLAEMMSRFHRLGLVEMSLYPASFTLNPGDRPTVSPLARFQARALNPLTNLRHMSVRIDDPVVAGLVELMDGSRSRSELLEAGIRLSSAHTTPQPVRDAESLDRALKELASLALLLP